MMVVDSVRALPQTPAIYLLTSKLSGKRYVGQARNLRTRWYAHRNAAQGAPNSSYGQQTAISRAMRTHGVANFTLTVLEHCAAEQLNEREQWWIGSLKTMVPDGYNLTSGGVPARRAKDVGARISAANKGRVKTPEWRAKLSAAHTGKKLSVEHRRKISEVQRGRKQSAESNLRRSLAMKGIARGPYSPAHRAAIAAGMSKEGHARSVAASKTPQAMERSRQARLGHKRTPEQCRRIREGVIRSYATRRDAEDSHA